VLGVLAAFQKFLSPLGVFSTTVQPGKRLLDGIEAAAE
jgi:hypothetical protein